MSTVALICPKHGFVKGDHCPQCRKDPSKRAKFGANIITDDWVKQGTFEHIDVNQPNMRFDSKKELIKACESRGLYAKALMKPKSRGRGWEHKKR